jgi:hypothetical protein
MRRPYPTELSFCVSGEALVYAAMIGLMRRRLARF